MKLALKGVLLVCVGCAVGCKDAFVKSLTNDKVLLMAPGNNVVSDSAQQNFFWEPVDTSIQYEFQVVTPAFDSVVSLVTDTTIGNNLFLFTLNPGQYQWRVRAFNSVSTTVFSTPWTITIN